MTSEEFRAIRKQLGLTQAKLASVLRYAFPVNVTHMESGRRDVPTHVAMLMRAFRDGWRPDDWPA